jgi:hypothetical protein
VVDETGAAVSGAAVILEPQFDCPVDMSPALRASHASSEMESVITDGDGRWHLERFSKQAIEGIFRIGANHSEYVAAGTYVYQQGSAQDPFRRSLLGGTNLFVLLRGLALRGIVLDMEGRPVAGARVGVRSKADRPIALTPEFAGVSVSRSTPSELTVVTNLAADGTFAATGCSPGTNLVYVEASGFAMTNLEVNLLSNSPPLRVSLRPGRLVRLRVVDENGQALPRTPVRMLAERYAALLGTRKPTIASDTWLTDSQGRFEWSSAPAEDVTVLLGSAARGRGDPAAGFALKADGVEHVIALTGTNRSQYAAGPTKPEARTAAVTVTATVKDASTGKPIPKFSVATSREEPGETNGYWDTTTGFKGGEFRSSLKRDDRNPDVAWRLKVLADGYAAFVTRLVRAEEGEVHFDIALQAAAPTVVTLLLPDGRPATNADVALTVGQNMPHLLPGAVVSSYGIESASLDAHGQFKLAPDETLGRVIAACPEGYAEADPAALAASPTMQLLPWGRIEGRLLFGGKPDAGRKLSLGPNGSGYVSLDTDAFRVETDGDGHFLFPRVPPGRQVLVRTRPAGGTVSLSEVDVRGGETGNLTVNYSLQTVVAHARWPVELKRQAGWQLRGQLTNIPLPPRETRGNADALAAWRAKPEVATAYEHLRVYVLKEATDSTMQADDVTPGTYTLLLLATDSSAGGRRTAASAEARVTVPFDPPGGTIDLGEFTMEPVPEPPARAAADDRK